MKKPELLSPVGNIDCLYAAIEGGCDAVYLGGYTFGARNYAGNFSDEELIEAIVYAHLYGVKVYVTVNTLIYEEEIDMFLNYIDFLHKNNVDAVIIQDIGMMDLIRKTYPNLEIHASTQMHIHNIEAAKIIEEFGLKRAVIARETDIDTLIDIRKNTNIELEIFVHGALCMSYSGQCLMSSMIGNRSGNKGTCSQSCRMKYDVIKDKKINEFEYNLSTKDLCILDNIGQLIDIGIDSFKIEGRMKRAEYVYYVTKLYRKAIDEYIEKKTITVAEEERNTLKKLFNRDFTKGFLFNEDNNNFINNKRPNHMGIVIGNVKKTDENYVTVSLDRPVNQGDGIRIIGKNDVGLILNKIYKGENLVNSASTEVSFYVKEKVEIDSLVLITSDKKDLEQINREIKAKTRKVAINGIIKGQIGTHLELTLTDGINTISAESSFNIEKSINYPVTHERIKEQIEKMGNTIYKLNELEIYLPDDIYIKIQDINELRREATDKLNKVRIYKLEYIKKDYHITLNEYSELPGYTYELSDIKKINECKDYKEIYVEELTDKEKVVLKLPRIMNEFKSYENPLLVSEIGSLKYNPYYTDYSFNVVNSYAVAFLHSRGVKRITLSYELNDNQIKNLVESYINRYNKKPNLELIISSYPEVMVTKFNLNKYYNIKGDFYLKNENNNKFLVKEKHGLNYIYHYELIRKDSQKYFDLGINTLRIIV